MYSRNCYECFLHLPFVPQADAGALVKVATGNLACHVSHLGEILGELLTGAADAVLLNLRFLGFYAEGQLLRLRLRRFVCRQLVGHEGFVSIRGRAGGLPVHDCSLAVQPAYQVNDADKRQNPRLVMARMKDLSTAVTSPTFGSSSETNFASSPSPELFSLSQESR